MFIYLVVAAISITVMITLSYALFLLNSTRNTFLSIANDKEEVNQLNHRVFFLENQLANATKLIKELKRGG